MISLIKTHKFGKRGQARVTRREKGKGSIENGENCVPAAGGAASNSNTRHKNAKTMFNLRTQSPIIKVSTAAFPQKITDENLWEFFE
jgi:hypothetical protein